MASITERSDTSPLGHQLASLAPSRPQSTSKAVKPISRSFSRSRMSYFSSSSSLQTYSTNDCSITLGAESKAAKSRGFFRRLFGISVTSMMELNNNSNANNLASQSRAKPRKVIVSAPISSPGQSCLNVTNPPPPSLPELDITPNQPALSVSFDGILLDNSSSNLSPNQIPNSSINEFNEQVLTSPATIRPPSIAGWQTETAIQNNNNYILTSGPESPTSSLILENNGIVGPDLTTITITADLIYNGKFDQVQQNQYAQWLGDEGEISAAVRQEFMHYFDFSNKNILFALRCLCIRLHMKAESQQLDRLIDSFAHAWVRANPDHGFLNQSIVYTIAYSILLLNTDIHKANHISGKSMSRSIFTENTLTTLLELSGYENGIPPALSHSNRLSLLLLDDKSYHKESSIGEDSDILLHSANPLSKAEWCHRMRLVLKNFHYSISKDVLHLAEVVHNDNDSLISVASYTSLNPLSNNFNGNLFYNSGEQSSTQNVSSFERSSFHKHVPNKYSISSDTTYNSSNLNQKSSNSHRMHSFSTATNNDSSVLSKLDRKSSIIGKLSKLRISRNVTYENESRLRPNEIHSRISSFYSRKSMDSLLTISSKRYSFGPEFRVLSCDNASIAENNCDSKSLQKQYYEFEEPYFGEGDFERLEQELAFESEPYTSRPPWIKEGVLLYRASIDPDTGKSCKKKNWKEVVVVIKYGQIKLYQNDKQQGTCFASENPVALDGFNLCQTMAQSDSSTCSTEIGYCATWSLILPSLGILTFQAPTKQIASEFIYTSNYWAARLSKEPLTEIVSNADYGWGSSLYNVLNATESQSPLSNSSSSSFNNSFKLFNSSLISSRSSNQRTPAKIKDWDPISHSMVISNLTEREQFEALKQYIHRVERDLKDHQNLKEKLTKVFIPGSLNWEKSNKNWAKKLDYLQKQKIRYSCYIKTLEKAFVDKERYPVKLVLKNNESTQELLK